MKQLFTLLLTVLALSISYAQQTIDVSKFSGISVKTSATVNLTQGSEYSVKISGDEEAMKKAEIYVRGNTLIIGSDNDWSWFGSNRGDLIVDVTTPEINEISLSGSGRLYGKNKFKTGDLELSVSGSGKMEIDCEAASTSVSISGSGKIYIKGSTNKIHMAISGSGKVNGEDFRAKSCQVTISGSGSTEIYVEESLKAKISGSGSVYYSGNPDNVDSHTSGSGRVKKV